MELFERIIKAVDENLIYCLIPMILTLMLIEFLFKNRFPTKKLLGIIRWVIISYSVLTLIRFIIEVTFYPGGFAFIERVIGPYKFTYWIMFLSATIFPLTLLSKKLASKFWYVLLIAFLIKIGAYFEYFVIIATSILRDYNTENWYSDSLNLWTYGILMTALQSFLLVILILGILKVTERK